MRAVPSTTRCEPGRDARAAIAFAHTSTTPIVRCVARALLALSLAGCAAAVSPSGRDPTQRAPVPAAYKPRVVVTTDPELDDANSLIRYLLYSSDFRTEGLIYASSQYHWKGDGRGTTWAVPNREYFRFGLKLCPCESWRWTPGEQFIDDAVDLYE